MTDVRSYSRYFEPRRLTHANLLVENCDRSVDFYTRVAGFHEVERRAGLASFLSNGSSYHDLALVDIYSEWAKPGARPGLNHLAFELESEAEMAAGYRAAVADGVAFKATADQIVARSVYALDPDGQTAEVYADIVPDWRAAKAAAKGRAKERYVPAETHTPVAERFYPVDPPVAPVADAIFRPSRVSHGALATTRFAAMVGFYRDLIGLRLVAGGPDAAFALFAGTMGDEVLAVLPVDDAANAGLLHVSARLPDEAELTRGLAGLAAAGIAVEAEIDHPARRAVIVRDPDGIAIQFYVDRDWRPERLAGIDAATARVLL